MEKGIILENSRIYHSNDIKVAAKELVKSRILVLYIIMSIIFVALGGFLVGLSFSYDKNLTILFSGIFILVIVLLMWGMYAYTFIKINKKDYKDTEYRYTFYEDEVIIDTNAKNLDQHMILTYDQFLTGKKSKNYTFLYINRQQALFFLNTDLNEEVYKLLKNKVNRFKDWQNGTFRYRKVKI